MISTIHSGVSYANVIIFLSLVLQLPLAFIMLFNLNTRDFHSLIRTLNYVCLLQIVLALVQIFLWRRSGDSINGSMLGDKHGTHIMPFMLYVSLLLNWKLEIISKRLLSSLFILISFIAIKADAKLVLFAVAIFLIIVTIKNLFSAKSSLAIKGTAAFSIVTTILLLIGSSIPNYIQTRWGYETENAFGSKSIILQEYFSSNSTYGLETSVLVGAGPTQTVSRSAVIAQATSSNTPAYTALSVSQPKFYSEYIQTTGRFNIGPISSLMQPVSSIVGILGDIGILGSIILIFFVFWPLTKLFSKSKRNKMIILSLLILFLIPLSYFNTFLEFPQAVFPLVITLVGLSMRSLKA